MSRRDSYLDAMLKHLGATYYQTLEGEATSSDVVGAIASVREEMTHHPGSIRSSSAANTAAQPPVASTGCDADRSGDGREASPVTDIARLMSDHRVSAMPVLADNGR